MPFAITPDPAYLFLSARHQEALGHLLYGTGQYGGFVQLTGEVGTGKTTVMRTLLEQKLGEVDVAIVYNPRLDEREFVQTICDELHVSYPADARLKSLIDALNQHLLATHAAGRRTVLIIDEAQNLDRNLLEQVRLLTNLETPKAKLLRVMLIGQPELADMLERDDLRQLASRITARFHLTPLTESETGDYIRHRLRVAGSHDDLIPPAAIREVYRYSQGLPRQINILCDRALLGAYSLGLRQVTAEVVHQAAREALSRQAQARGRGASARRNGLHYAEIGVLGAAALLAVALLWRSLLPAAPTPTTESGAAPSAAPAALATPHPTPAPTVDENTTAAAPAAAPSGDLGKVLAEAESLARVMSGLIRQWDPTLQVPRNDNVCRYLAERQLECFRAVGNWSELQALDRPAILMLRAGRDETRHVLLRALDEHEALLLHAGEPLRVSRDALDALWTGDYLLLWRRPVPEPSLQPGMRSDSVIWLRHQLTLNGGLPFDDNPSPLFDRKLQAAVIEFQAARNLSADGIVGMRTFLALGGDLQAPSLRMDPESMP